MSGVAKALSVVAVVIVPTAVVILLEWAFAMIGRELDRRRSR
jgi:hypothetical protein